MKDTIVQIAISVFGSVLASSGLWAWIMARREKKDAKGVMLMGLAHDRILSLGSKYLERGYVTADEYENMYEYLYKPYQKLGGNGSAQRIMEQVKKLPIKPNN